MICGIARLSTSLTRRIVCPVLCESSVSPREPQAIALVASVLCAVSCPRLPLLSASRSCSGPCTGWMWQDAPFAAPGWLTGTDNTSRSFRWWTACRAFPLPLAHLVPSVRIAAGAGMIVSLAMPGGDRHNYALWLLAFPLFSPLANTGGSRKRRDSFHDVFSPSE
jgi:hypothetical protein